MNVKPPFHQETRDTELVGLKSVQGGSPNQQVPMKTMTYLQVDPEVRANMRGSTRWDYVSEYIGYWIDNKRFWVLAVLFVVAGVLLLDVFAPVALLMIAVGAKYRNIAWMDNFIYSKFGEYRSLVLVD
ncbi:hypothetical protein KJ765_06010 [Candidatus Micrarchaeota archaeon]|nr:hypothetical protein [Candidatus Micrarchaeota archaeon]